MIHRSIGAVSHGIIDYALAILLAAGPTIAGFNGRQATWAYLFAAVLFVLAVMTRYPLGIVRVIGLGIHGFVELVLACCLIAAPWYGNFIAGVHSRNFYWMMGLVMLVLWALTDFRGIRNRPPAAPVARVAPAAPVAGRADGPAAKGR